LISRCKALSRGLPLVATPEQYASTVDWSSKSL
jgi:hypothetical protein